MRMHTHIHTCAHTQNRQNLALMELITGTRKFFLIKKAMLHFTRNISCDKNYHFIYCIYVTLIKL